MTSAEFAEVVELFVDRADAGEMVANWKRGELELAGVLEVVAIAIDGSSQNERWAVRVWVQLNGQHAASALFPSGSRQPILGIA
jgi:hypothetical protein